MEGQNIKKIFQQKELNWMCKTAQKTRNFIYAFPRDKMTPTRAEKLNMRK